VAFTIEADNEFEQRMPHSASEERAPGQAGRRGGPWLISMPFWSMCLAHVPAEGTTVGEVLERGFLEDTFLLGTNPGMVRWGYLGLEPGNATSKRPSKSWLVKLRPAGRRAQQIWAPIPDMVEQRWQGRWTCVKELRLVLEGLVGRFDNALPDHVPINGAYQSRVSIPTKARPRVEPQKGADLSSLLAQALVQFTIEVEHVSPLAMVHAANVGRVLMDGSVARRNLPNLTGVARETLAVMVGILEKKQMLASESGNTVALTAEGHDAAAATFAAVADVEARWGAAALRESLQALVGDGTLTGSPLRLAVDPPKGTWRANRRPPATLPHHPVVSHRGGYPDGS
jgi:hypothetical protein